VHNNPANLNASATRSDDCDLRISEIAVTAGFHSLSQFNRVFKQFWGKSPTRYRASKRMTRRGERCGVPGGGRASRHFTFLQPSRPLEQRLKQDAEATRIGLSAATRKASVSLAECDGDEVVYVAARLKDVVSSAAQVHGWNQPAVNVNIANIPMPTAEERAEMRALDKKLDAFAAMLKRRPVAGRG
jgi:Helix-turn-helix domain